MCGRFTLIISPEILSKTFDLQELPIDLEPRYNIAPSQPIAAIRNIGEHNKLNFIKWGLLPHWARDTTHSPINAKSETVHEKPMFQHAIKYNRCIIPASGFYEWLPTKDNHKQPYYIRLLNSRIMGLAGLWERWNAEDGSEVETCCILTTEANELVKPIHDRMPVILQPDDYTLWLSRHMHDPHELQRMYKPYPSELMVANVVPDLVNNPRFDSPACIVQM
jgi:putative SOS response-associated peptidase YedK